MSKDCVCHSFHSNECVVEIEYTENGVFFVCATITDRQALKQLIDDLRKQDATVHLEQLLPLDHSSAMQRTLELDTSEVTEKQREAIEVAVNAGYYERPRQSDLAALSEQLGISESAVSQRLNGAESALIREMASATGNALGR